MFRLLLLSSQCAAAMCLTSLLLLRAQVSSKCLKGALGKKYSIFVANALQCVACIFGNFCFHLKLGCHFAQDSVASVGSQLRQRCNANLFYLSLDPSKQPLRASRIGTLFPLTSLKTGSSRARLHLCWILSTSLFILRTSIVANFASCAKSSGRVRSFSLFIRFSWHYTQVSVLIIFPPALCRSYSQCRQDWRSFGIQLGSGGTDRCPAPCLQHAGMSP